MEPVFPRTSTPEQMPSCVQDTQISVTVAADEVFRVDPPPPGPPPGTILSSRILNDDDWHIVYQISISYDIDTGDVVMPAAGPKGSSGRPVKLHGGAARKTVGWVAERVGSQPILPHWDSSDLWPAGNLVLRSRTLEADSIDPLSDGVTPVFRYRGAYVYDFVVPPGDSDSLPLCTTVILNIPAGQYALSAPLFDRSLLAALTGYAVQAPLGYAVQG
jgi:hypothetical protein